ncbi:MAG: hypothetical protein IJ736_01670 [Firmicutes bacterium]|nr:hypothetical protein [Bacillota bacterium]
MKLDLYGREHERLGKYSEKVSTIKKFRYVLDEDNLLKVVDDDIAEKLLDEEE